MLSMIALKLVPFVCRTEARNTSRHLPLNARYVAGEPAKVLKPSGRAPADYHGNFVTAYLPTVTTSTDASGDMAALFPPITTNASLPTGTRRCR